MDVVFRFASRIIVMVGGRILVQGAPDDIARDERVREVYLGKAACSLLELKGVRAGYGDAVVLDDVSLEVPRNGSLAVLGRNGVGKSTLLLTIMGYTRLHHGRFSSRARTSRRCHRTAARSSASAGWRRSARSFLRSRVEENLTVAARPGRWGLDAVYALFPRAERTKATMGNQLSGGEQQMLAIARALMTNPALLLLDEPLEGLAPIIVEALAEAFKKLTADEPRDWCWSSSTPRSRSPSREDAVVIERGRIVHRARSAELARDPAMLERVLGLHVT